MYITIFFKNNILILILDIKKNKRYKSIANYMRKQVKRNWDSRISICKFLKTTSNKKSKY